MDEYDSTDSNCYIQTRFDLVSCLNIIKNDHFGIGFIVIGSVEKGIGNDAYWHILNELDDDSKNERNSKLVSKSLAIFTCDWVKAVNSLFCKIMINSDDNEITTNKGNAYRNFTNDRF